MIRSSITHFPHLIITSNELIKHQPLTTTCCSYVCPGVRLKRQSHRERPPRVPPPRTARQPPPPCQYFPIPESDYESTLRRHRSWKSYPSRPSSACWPVSQCGSVSSVVSLRFEKHIIWWPKPTKPTVDQDIRCKSRWLFSRAITTRSLCAKSWKIRRCARVSEQLFGFSQWIKSSWSVRVSLPFQFDSLESESQNYIVSVSCLVVWPCCVNIAL